MCVCGGGASRRADARIDFNSTVTIEPDGTTAQAGWRECMLGIVVYAEYSEILHTKEKTRRKAERSTGR